MKTKLAGLGLSLALSFAPHIAHAEDRDFCANRPGLGTPACTLAPGRAMIEVGLAGWDHTTDSASIEDQVTLGDALLRVGVTETTEVQIGVASHVIDRIKDRASGLVARTTGIGDGTFAVRQSLSGPNGKIAVQAFVSTPLKGGGPASFGMLVPAGFDLPSGFELDLTPELDLAANESANGHHLAWGGVVGLSHPLGKQVSLTGEVAAFRDDDPAGHSTDARVAGSIAWQVSDRFQLDFEADAGLSSGAPDRSLLVGLAWQFR
ncbi:MAG TPA: transporter [Sphingomicrobium sp.]